MAEADTSARGNDDRGTVLASRMAAAGEICVGDDVGCGVCFDRRLNDGHHIRTARIAPYRSSARLRSAPHS